MRHALVLFSGGIDSTAALYWARERFDRVSALTFEYGQRHKVEVRLARRLTGAMGIPHEEIRLDLTQIGGSALTDPAIPVPEGKDAGTTGGGPPATYVPFRNGIFLSLAAAWAEVRGPRDIVCGFHIIDSPEYPDTRTLFVDAMQKAINQGTRAAFGGDRFVLHAPFLDIDKAGIIREGLKRGADFSYSISCYAGGEVPCGRCASCLIRRRAWEEIGKEDHLLVRLRKEGRA